WAIALAFLPVKPHVLDFGFKRWRTQDKINTHSLIAREAKLLIIPVSVAYRDTLTSHINETNIKESLECCSFWRGHMGATLEKRDIPDIGVKRSNIEVTHQCERHIRMLL